jgi:hypothetical protein
MTDYKGCPISDGTPREGKICIVFKLNATYFSLGDRYFALGQLFLQ